MPLILLTFLISVALINPAFAADSSWWSNLVAEIRLQQQSFHRELAGAIRAIQEGGMTALWAMVVTSFLYGVFHAAGPGHGKAIISTYLVSHESKLKRGIFLSFASAFAQGVSAIVIVEGLVGILGWSRSQAKGITPYLETASFALVAIIGLVLMKRAISGFIKQRRHTHNHPHDHDHDHHHHDHHHECSSCGHGPKAEDLDKASSWRDSLSIILSVGIRPCSGSVLVLIFAEIIGLRWAGIASVMAISFGTALTVGGLAILSVYFRKSALYLAERHSSQALQNLSLSAALAGGLFIALLGGSLMLESATTSHPLF